MSNILKFPTTPEREPERPLPEHVESYIDDLYADPQPMRIKLEVIQPAPPKMTLGRALLQIAAGALVGTLFVLLVTL